MIVLGADTHKRSHAIAAVAAPTGERLGEQIVPVGQRGFGALLQWARSSTRTARGRLRIADTCRGRWSGFLIERGERVLRIPTHLTAKARKSARQRGKSDPIDALNVARVALQEGLQSFRRRTWTGPSWICGCSSTIANGWSAIASSSTARCSGICTICGRSCGCRAARCSRRGGARGSAGVWPGPSKRCAFGSRATSCAACAS